MNKKFAIKNKHNQNIIGVISGLEADKKKPVVIFLHGFKGDKDQLHIKYPSEKLAKNGFITVRFDGTNGLGDSDGNIFDCSTSHYLDDLDATLNYIYSLNGVDKNKICLFGTSWGGMVAFLNTSENNKIKVLILHESNYDWVKGNMNKNPNEWKKKGYKIVHSRHKNIDVKVGYNFYDDGLKYDTKAAIKKIRCPVLVLQGSVEDDTQLESTQELIGNLNTDNELKIIPGAPHSPKEKVHLEMISNVITKWLKDKLKLTEPSAKAG